MQIDFENLDLARQVLDRQANTHLPAMKDHLTTWATLEAGDLGLILQALKPANDALVDGGEQVLEAVKQIYTEGAENLGGVINSYADAEQQAYETLQSVATTIGLSLPPYADPRDSLPTLGSAKDDAGPYYRSGDPNLFQQAFEDGYRAGDMVADEVVGGISERIGEMSGASATVAEEQDVQSYLVTPTGSFSEVENLRWEAGVILGSLDWVFEKLFGFSFLNDVVYKPFAGDWNRVQAASGAWTIAGDAIGAVSQNTTGILPGLAEWTGKGSEAFAVAAAAMAVADNALGSAASLISTAIKGLAMLVKMITKQIGKILKRLSYKLARIAAEAAIPVVGWAAAVVELATTVNDIYEDFRWAYKWINRIYDFISNIVAAKASIVDTYRQVSQVVEALGRGAAARA
ncbi:MAG: hypothetical protein Q4D79_15310 [Propionibacteriaceae bacterium]|nr:hypothetical protein [Propionibacteriaceae bacterium]